MSVSYVKYTLIIALGTSYKLDSAGNTVEMHTHAQRRALALQAVASWRGKEFP